ncbi:hypothetical protein, variant [Verruconis gallopava]|nr:hypothetical protein, variant [Verruconis gallopava]KIW09135.1 hypothetical protein, variant [Verruconis gallopava]
MVRRFLSLPAELRHKVYCNLLKDKDQLYVKANRVHIWPNHEHPHLSAQFLRTCKTIHSEALAVLYGSVIFSAELAADLTRFFVSIGANGRRHIKRLCIGPQPLPEKLSSFELPSLGVQRLAPDAVWSDLESLEEVTVAYTLWRTSPPALQTAINFVQRMAKSTPRLGHFFYDYMALARRPEVKWYMVLKLRQESWYPQIGYALLEEIVIWVSVNILDSETDGEIRRVWFLKGRHEDAIVPFSRHL